MQQWRKRQDGKRHVLYHERCGAAVKIENMKPFFILLILLSSFSGRAACNDDHDVMPQVLASFQNNFKDAREVHWQERRDFYRVEFMIGSQHFFAFYDKGGDMICTGRNLNFGQLPSMLQLQFWQRYDGYWITELFELSDEENTGYYIAVENAEYKVILQSLGNSWTLVRKMKK